mmetsp:Transcript_57466/g.175003  ORF Transcript_57466/g.175003 Transcript_57466/m.175003 type:complete len:250 (-) Transcript_57466:150-899(-)
MPFPCSGSRKALRGYSTVTAATRGYLISSNAEAEASLSGRRMLAVTWLGAVNRMALLRNRLDPSGVSYSSTCSCRSPSHAKPLSFHCSRTWAPPFPTASATASANCFKPFRKDPTVWPFTSGSRGSRGGWVSASWARWRSNWMAPASKQPPFFSSTWTRPVAASADRALGLPAYTPLTKGSIKRSKASSPKLRVTNSLTDSSLSGIGSLMPMAPKPARIFPGQVRKSPVTRSRGPAGSARNRPSHHTKR